MNRHQFILLLACAFAVSCAPKKATTRASTQPNPVSPVMDDVDERMNQLQKFSTEFSEAAKKLPGRNTAEDRAMSVDAFDRASSAIALLGGPHPGGAIRQDLRIIDNTRQRLKATAGDANYDPTVDTGLRAIHNALLDVQQRLYPTNAKIRQQLDVVSARVDDLDTVRGPLHALAAAHVFTASADVVETMSEMLEGRTSTATSLPAGEPAPLQTPIP